MEKEIRFTERHQESVSGKLHAPFAHHKRHVTSDEAAHFLDRDSSKFVECVRQAVVQTGEAGWPRAAVGTEDPSADTVDGHRRMLPKCFDRVLGRTPEGSRPSYFGRQIFYNLYINSAEYGISITPALGENVDVRRCRRGGSAFIERK